MKIDKNTVVNISQFASYIGKHRETASKYYKAYLSMVGKKDFHSLTVADIAKLDDLTVETIIIRIWN